MVLAAHRAALSTVILPKRNERDLEELPEDLRSRMSFVLVERIDEALSAALGTKSTHSKDPKGQKRIAWGFLGRKPSKPRHRSRRRS